MQHSGNERRQVRRRIDTEVPVLDTGSGARVGRIFDLTEEGFMLLAGEPFTAGSHCHFTICLPEPYNREVRLLAECMWCADSSFGQFCGSGFYIEQVSASDRQLLLHFLQEF